MAAAATTDAMKGIKKTYAGNVSPSIIHRAKLRASPKTTTSINTSHTRMTCFLLSFSLNIDKTPPLQTVIPAATH